MKGQSLLGAQQNAQEDCNEHLWSSIQGIPRGGYESLSSSLPGAGAVEGRSEAPGRAQCDRRLRVLGGTIQVCFAARVVFPDAAMADSPRTYVSRSCALRRQTASASSLSRYLLGADSEGDKLPLPLEFLRGTGPSVTNGDSPGRPSKTGSWSKAMVELSLLANNRGASKGFGDGSFLTGCAGAAAETGACIACMLLIGALLADKGGASLHESDKSKMFLSSDTFATPARLSDSDPPTEEAEFRPTSGEARRLP